MDRAVGREDEKMKWIDCLNIQPRGVVRVDYHNDRRYLNTDR